MTLQEWLPRAAVDDRARPGRTQTGGAELRDAPKRIRLLEHEKEVLRRTATYLSPADLLGKGSARS